MNTILISYDLWWPETSTDYQNLITEIKSIGTRCHPLESFWFVKTDLDSVWVRELLKLHLDANDELLCMNVTGDWWASLKLWGKITDRMKQNI